MSVTRAIAGAAMLAGLAVGTTSTAWAAPTMSGHYIDTETARSGLSTTNDWYVTLCGDGCASINYNGGSLAQAQLVNGQWAMDVTGDASCPDGSRVYNAFADHYTWDPNTLAGIVHITNTGGACGGPVGETWTVSMQLRQAPR
jgi:hypothetical protein